MLTLSIMIALAVVTTGLMAANWYIWEPRYRTSGRRGPDLRERQTWDNKNQNDLRSAA
jgi:hypothetical protein